MEVNSIIAILLWDIMWCKHSRSIKEILSVVCGQERPGTRELWWWHSNAVKLTLYGLSYFLALTHSLKMVRTEIKHNKRDIILKIWKLECNKRENHVFFMFLLQGFPFPWNCHWPIWPRSQGLPNLFQTR